MGRVNLTEWKQLMNLSGTAINIDDIPSEIDVAPVRHGKWEVSESGEMCTCSECGAVFDISIGTGCYVDGEELELPKYCLNCGAKMDAERKEE